MHTKVKVVNSLTYAAAASLLQQDALYDYVHSCGGNFRESQRKPSKLIFAVLSFMTATQNYEQLWEMGILFVIVLCMYAVN